MTKRLLIRLDAEHTFGHGHAVRTAALVSHLKTLVEPIVLGDVVRLPEALAEARTCPLANSRPETLAATIKELRPDAILVDLPLRAERPWGVFRQADVPVIALDDEGGELDADLVINGTVLDAYHHYSGLPPSARCLLGPRYALLRPSFATSSWHWRPGRRLAVFVGSGARASQWAHELAVDGLAALHLDAADMVVGVSFPHLERLRTQALARGISVHEGLNAERMASLMAGASIALMTGGMVVYEALAVGVPAVVFPQISNMVPEMTYLAARMCVHDLGYEGGMHMDDVRAAADHLLSHPEAARWQSQLGRAIIDGRGMERAALAIDEVLAA